LTALKDKIEFAISETRVLILGAQVLIGLDYQSVFQPGFQRLELGNQALKLASLGLLMLATALLCAPAPYYCVVEKGEHSWSFHAFITRMAEWSLLPMAIALGIDLYLAGLQAAGPVAGKAVGIAGGAAAFLLWYGWEWATKRTRSKKISVVEKKEPEQPLPVAEKIKDLLREDRVVLPGVQALLGFQFVVILVDGFQKMPQYMKYVHVASLCLMSLSTILLIAPAAYHRIVEQGEATERFYRLASMLLILALVPLALGMCGDLFVVVMQVTKSMTVSLTVSSVMLLVFYGLWFGYAFYRRSKQGKTAPEKKVLPFTRTS